jgi:predicted ATPase
LLSQNFDSETYFMALHSDVRKLQNKWLANTGWPKQLEWIQIKGLRGWSGQRVDFNFPIVAIVGENGSGKSTILQCAASVYQPPANASGDRGHYPTDFLPDTPWDRLRDSEIVYSVRQGNETKTDRLRKLERWRGYNKRPERYVQYIDLSRVQPISARSGYFRLANPQLTEASSIEWDPKKVSALSHIMGREYQAARSSITSADPNRGVPILKTEGIENSGFHHGAGELTMEDLLGFEFKEYSLVLIDEIETSLHPRVQRRLMRWLAEQSRQLNLQIIVTTHSPYILRELPPEARLYILGAASPQKTVVTGVSPEFAMSQMDDENYPECDLYVEDARSGDMLLEILVKSAPEIVSRCEVTPYGAASAGFVLGKMVKERRFRLPTCVFVDGDQEEREGCHLLPGDEAPERVVFSELKNQSWPDLAKLLNRDYSSVADACSQAMTYDDHHEWVKLAANKLIVSGEILWHQMCSAWAQHCLSDEQADAVAQPVRDALARI